MIHRLCDPNKCWEWWEWLVCVSTQKGVRNKRFRSREVGVSERTFHPLLPGECQAEGDRGLQIPLWGSGQCRVFRQYFKPHTHTFIHTRWGLSVIWVTWVNLLSCLVPVWFFSLFLLVQKVKLLCPFLQVTAECPVVCECPAVPPSCPPGVSSVPDGCGCCKVCAAQLNQDCHEGRPCDHHKGLECNYGNDVGRTHGICRGMYHRGGRAGMVGVGRVEKWWIYLFIFFTPALDQAQLWGLK